MKMKTTALITIAGLALAGSASAAGPGGPVLHISSHLDHAAKVSVDGRPAVVAPGDGSVETPIAAGDHVLSVTAPGGVAYRGHLHLTAPILMHWHGRAYWCVNLLKNALEPYSKDECQEEVTDAG
jgi:hypothetical protein